MPRSIDEEELKAIEAAVAAHPGGISLQGILYELEFKTVRRTLQFRLKRLVDQGRLTKQGDRRWARYSLPETANQTKVDPGQSDGRLAGGLTLTRQALDIRERVRQPLAARTPVGYRRAFLDAYRPNESAYLSASERTHLGKVGNQIAGEQPAGTHARKILNRLLVDLSWNSSRLEGNSYSLHGAKRLIELGVMPEGRTRLEAQMILNHKDAIEFLAGSAEAIGFNRYTILNLHALLANNLLADPYSTGRIRRMPVGIGGSVYHPLEVPQLIEECLDQILATAAAINDPFEQALFVMAQQPYLQPFDDVNKRVSRLAANIPLIKANLAPLSFTGVSVRAYTDAMLGVYELNQIELLKELFIWAYERSAAVRQKIGAPDQFRIKHREALLEVVRHVVIERKNRKEAYNLVATQAGRCVEVGEVGQFREIAENELLSLHEGNFARYRITPSQFKAWQDVWNSKGDVRPASSV